MFDDGAGHGASPDRVPPSVGGLTPADLESMPPGPALAAVLAGMEPRVMAGYDLVSYLGACERQSSWTAALQLAAVAELAHRRPVLSVEVGGPQDRIERGTVSRFAAHEIAAELRISRLAAEDKLDLALQLERLAATRTALSTGSIDLPKARAVAGATRDLATPEARAVEASVLPRAPEQVLGGLKESLSRAVLRVDPAAAQKRHRRAVSDRKVELVPLADGMSGIWALLRADHAVAVFEGITALAEKAKAPGDERTLDQRRADVLADIGGSLLGRPDLPRRHGRRPHLHVTVAATTLLGLDDCPGQLAGHGPVPAELAREIAGDATWTRILTDPVSGTLVDLGTTVYRPPQALADRLIAKHQRCRGPGCRMPASRCHLDHTVAFPDGPTAESNLGPLCESDHIRKHRAGWGCAQDADGTYRWTSPTGHVYLDRLEPMLEPGPHQASCRHGPR